jgi:hypothetical protein
MAKLNAQQLAQQSALQGDTGAAIEQLTALLEGGEGAAAASLAQIAGFRGQWREVLRHALTFLQNPAAAHYINVTQDSVRLVALAGIQIGGWPEIHAELVALRQHWLADAKLKAYINEQDSSGIDQLIALAKSDGQARYVWDWVGHGEGDEDARAAKAEAAIADKLAKHAKKKLFADDAERRGHFFALARVMGSHRVAVRLFDEEGVADLIRFDAILFTASALARAGRTEQAWQVVEKAVPKWWPVSVAQVAPVDLLTDEALRPLLTPERCEWVLSTPRGPAAAPKAKPKASQASKPKPAKRKKK